MAASLASPKSSTLTIPLAHHDIGRLQVPVRDAVTVGNRECIDQRDDHVEERVEGELTLCEHLLERLSLDQLHRQEVDAVDLVDGVDRDDVRMIQAGQGPGFAPEARKPVGIGHKRLGEDLQRNLAVELRIAGAIHLPHAALADLRGDFIRAEACAGSEGQTVGV